MESGDREGTHPIVSVLADARSFCRWYSGVIVSHVGGFMCNNSDGAELPTSKAPFGVTNRLFDITEK